MENAQLGVPKVFDLLSLDIDHNTYYAWERLKAYRPRIVVVEYNALILPGIDWKVHYEARRLWTGTSNFGANPKAFQLLGNELGYESVGCDFIRVNVFFCAATWRPIGSRRASSPRITKSPHGPHCRIGGAIARRFSIGATVAASVLRRRRNRNPVEHGASHRRMALHRPRAATRSYSRSGLIC
jgi:hypothetical protein